LSDNFPFCKQEMSPHLHPSIITKSQFFAITFQRHFEFCPAGVLNTAYGYVMTKNEHGVPPPGLNCSQGWVLQSISRNRHAGNESYSLNEL